MKFKYFIVSILVTIVVFLSCKEEEDVRVVTIVIPSSGGADTTNDNTGSNGTSQFKAITWNIEQFSASNTNFTTVKSIINAYKADVYAIQELNKSSDFFSLISSLGKPWSGFFVEAGSLDYGFIYNTNTVQSLSAPKELSSIGNASNFAGGRFPAEWKIQYDSSEVIYLLNLHLKCCSEGYNQRVNASSAIKTYVDNNLANDQVIILGDFNDEIKDDGFDIFIDNGASSFYSFTDLAIENQSSNYSFPSANGGSFNSHLDHILITNELFTNHVKTETLKPDVSYSNYFSEVSDHRPVMATFGF